MSAGLSFGALPSFADLSPDQQAMVMQALQQQGQPANAPQASPVGLLGQMDPQGAPPPGTPGLGDLMRSGGQGGPSVAMSEADTRRLERQMASPQDLAALGGSPVDQLLYDRSGMGGGPNQFVRGPGQVGTAGSPDTGPIDQRDPSHPGASRGVRLPDPSATGSVGADGPGFVPLPPQRPAAADLMVPPPAPPVSGMNPGAMPTGGPNVPANTIPQGATPSATAAGPISAPNVGQFDPLTGQVVSGSPRPIGAPSSAGSPTGAAPSSGQAGSLGGGSLLEKFANRLNNPDVGNLLLNIGMGLMSQRGFGPGITAGLQSYQSSQAGSVKNLLEQVKLQQTLQGQQAIRQAFAGKGLSPAMVEAAALDPTVRSSVLAQINRQPQQIDYNGERYMGVPGTDPSTWQHLGSAGAPLDQEIKKADALATVADAHKDDTIRYITDPNTKQQYPFNESAYLRAQAAGTRGAGGSGTGPQAGAGADASPLGSPITGKGPTPAEEAEQRIIGDARGKILSSAIEAGDPARKRMAVTDQMAAALNQAAPNMTTGPLSGSIMTAKEALAGVLGRPIEGLSGQEMLNSMGPILAGEAAKGITSRPALAEFKAIANVKPGQQFSVEGNRALLDVIRQNAQREADLSDLASNAKDAGEFAQKREGYLRDNPLINPFTQKPFGSASGSGPGMSLGANAGGGQSTGSPGDAGARFQQLVGSGMSKADAYAQMHREGL